MHEMCTGPTPPPGGALPCPASPNLRVGANPDGRREVLLPCSECLGGGGGSRLASALGALVQKVGQEGSCPGESSHTSVAGWRNASEIQLCVALESRALGVKRALLVPGASPLLALMPWENQVWGLPKVTLQYSQNQDPDQLALAILTPDSEDGLQSTG